MNLITKLSDGSYNYLPDVNIANYINENDDRFLIMYYMNESNTKNATIVNNKCDKCKYFYE